MFCDISSYQMWQTHLTRRAAEAIALDFIDSNISLSWQGAKVFVPTNLDCKSISVIDPQTSLRILQAGSSVEREVWVTREDLFTDAARWLSKSFAADPDAWLVCEAGYAEVGDKVLQQRPHIMHGTRPLLHIKIGGSSVEDIATTLRWGRSWRSLGVVQPGNVAVNPFRPSTQGLFFCDAFDGDSLVVADFFRVGHIDDRDRSDKPSNRP